MQAVDYIKQSPVRTFQRGEVLLQKGDALHFVMAIRDGFVKVSSISDDGIERLLWIAGRYDFAAVEQLFSTRGTSRFFYTALTNGSFYEVNREALLTYAKASPAFMTEVARGMSEHYDDFLQRVDAVDGLTVRERLLRTLLYLARRFDAGDIVNLYQQGLRLTHQDIAAMIGATRETTSHELGQLRLHGFIAYDRSSFIVHTRTIEQMLD